MQSRWFAPLLVLAALSGWLCSVCWGDVVWLSELTKLLQSAFLDALKMIIAPLIFFSLLSGVIKLREAGGMGRLGLVTVSYYAATSAVAIAIGLSIVYVYHPWTAFPPLQTIPDVDMVLLDASNGGLSNLLGNLLSSLLTNPFSALADTNILGILFSAIILGLAAARMLPRESNWPQLIDEINEVIFTVARWVISLLPLGLFAIAFQLADRIDTATFISLGYFVGVVLGATLFHGVVVLPLFAWVAAGVPPWILFPKIGQTLLTAAVTSSSAATLPLSLATARDKLGVTPSKAAFVLPLGATVNMDGTALFEGIAVVFLAYMFNVPLDGFALVVVFLVAMLASAGAPGIPSGSMAGLQTVLLAVGIPLEAIALILLIERPLDTLRTAVNVEGDLIGALVAEKLT